MLEPEVVFRVYGEKGHAVLVGGSGGVSGRVTFVPYVVVMKLHW
jgi:hypothetical protein